MVPAPRTPGTLTPAQWSRLGVFARWVAVALAINLAMLYGTRRLIFRAEYSENLVDYHELLEIRRLRVALRGKAEKMLGPSHHVFHPLPLSPIQLGGSAGSQIEFGDGAGSDGSADPSLLLERRQDEEEAKEDKEENPGLEGMIKTVSESKLDQVPSPQICTAHPEPPHPTPGPNSAMHTLRRHSPHPLPTCQNGTVSSAGVRCVSLYNVSATSQNRSRELPAP